MYIGEIYVYKNVYCNLLEEEWIYLKNFAAFAKGEVLQQEVVPIACIKNLSQMRGAYSKRKHFLSEGANILFKVINWYTW